MVAYIVTMIKAFGDALLLDKASMVWTVLCCLQSDRKEL